MVNKRRSLKYILISFLFLLRVYGAEELKPVQFRLIALGNVVEFLYDIDGNSKKLYASPGGFSKLYDASDGRNLFFYREVAAPPEVGGFLKVPVAEVTLPSGDGPFLIVLKPVEQGSEPYYRHAVFDASLDVHQSGYFRAFNFSTRKMAVQLAGKNMLLESGQSGLAPYPDGRKAWLKVAVSNDQEGDWMRVSSSPRAISENTRITIFLVDIPPSPQDPEPLGVSVREFRERVYEDDVGRHLR